MTIDRKSLINWVGGKRLLRKVIEPLVPTDIKSYIEPFGGGAWVLFYKEKWADLEVYNDLDGRLVNLFRIVKYHPNAFKEEIKYLLGSREMFLQFLNGTFITDIQRAVQFYFLITRSFGGRGETFGTVKRSCGGASKSQKNVLEKIDAIHNRLDKVMVENRDFEKLITQYDLKSKDGNIIKRLKLCVLKSNCNNFVRIVTISRKILKFSLKNADKTCNTIEIVLHVQI